MGDNNKCTHNGDKKLNTMCRLFDLFVEKEVVVITIQMKTIRHNNPEAATYKASDSEWLQVWQSLVKAVWKQDRPRLLEREQSSAWDKHQQHGSLTRGLVSLMSRKSYASHISVVPRSPPPPYRILQSLKSGKFHIADFFTLNISKMWSEMVKICFISMLNWQ